MNLLTFGCKIAGEVGGVIVFNKALNADPIAKICKITIKKSITDIVQLMNYPQYGQIVNNMVKIEIDSIARARPLQIVRLQKIVWQGCLIMEALLNI